MRSLVSRQNLRGNNRAVTEEGAATSVLLEASPLLDRNGRYFDNCKAAPLAAHRPEGKFGGVAAYALDGANAERLWEMAIKIAGEPKLARIYVSASSDLAITAGQ